MKEKILQMLLQGLFVVLTPETLKSFVDAGLDAIEDAVTKSENTIDDKVVLPMCKLIRNTFDIPDDDPVLPAPLPGEGMDGSTKGAPGEN